MRNCGRAALVPLIVLLSTGAGAQVAGARPWTATYDWQADSAAGYENWVDEEATPGSGDAPPFYRVYRGDAPNGIGRGLAIRPLGGRVYGNGNPGSQEGGPGAIVRWKAPGGSRITRAVYGDTKYRNEADGQYMRSRVTGPDGHTIDYGPDYDEDEPDRTYINPAPPFDRTFTAGTTAEFWLYTICGPNPDPNAPSRYLCPSVASGTGTFARVGTVNLTLDDPDQPAVVVESSPTIDDGWVNKRRTQRLTVTAADPSSGISRIRVQVRAGGATSGGRTLTDSNVTCDDKHRTAGRGGLVCPPTATATATDPGASQTAGDRTYVVTAWDYAGNQSVTIQTVRRDTEPPSRGDASGAELRALTDGWTNRIGQVPVRLAGEDSRAGVARLQLLARRVASGRATELADTAPACAGDCRRATETTTATLNRTTLPVDGRYRLEVRVTDRAGNAKTFRTGRTLKVDREAPRKQGPAGRATLADDGSLRLQFSPGRDAGESSGLGDVVVRYWVSPPTPPGDLLSDDDDLFDDVPAETRTPKLLPSKAKVIAAKIADLAAPSTGGPQTRRLQRSLRIPRVGNIDPGRPIEVYVFDRSKGQPVDPGLLNQDGNRRDELVTIAGSVGGPLQPGIGSAPPAAFGAYRPAGRWEERGRNPAASDFSPGGKGPSRGRSPEKHTPDQQQLGKKPWEQRTSALSNNAFNDRKMFNLKGKRINPWPMFDVYPRSGVGAQAARARGISAQTLEWVRTISGARSPTRAADGVKRRIPLLGDLAVGTNGKKIGVWRTAGCKALVAAHLVGAVFGSYGDDLRNFVALSQEDNIGMRTAFETDMRDIVKRHKNARFTYYVRALYDKKTSSLYPARFEASLELVQGEMNDGSKSFAKTGSYTTKDGRGLRLASSC